MRISTLTTDSVPAGLLTDEPPRIGFALSSDAPGEALASATVTVGGWSVETRDQVATVYTGPLAPRTEYPVHVRATGTSGETAEASTTFRTGRLGLPWTARWITDGTYRTPRKQSPVPMAFRRRFRVRPGLRRAWVECTALGVYELALDGAKVGEDYFAPGFTSYHHQLQYQTYDLDVAGLTAGTHTVLATVAGGWAVGSFTHRRKNKTYAPRQALLAELHLVYDDGTEVVATGPDWEVSTDGPYRAAEWYDGETFDARVREEDQTWRPVSVTKPSGAPVLSARYGPAVRVQDTLRPVSRTVAPSGELVYDFGQNFAGVVRARLRGEEGQVVVFRHAEVLADDELFVTSLRTARATATYTCVEGTQEYSPRLTYMGFRYVGVSGVAPEDLELEALVLHSDLPETGTFRCSDPLVDRLQEAIRWGGRSNFVDIPTDCP